jgi:DNA-binding transcriptional LysR family regulator
MDRIHSLRLFTRLVELGSFSRAAIELGIGQPSASKVLAQLEKRIGARLLHRSTRGVSPTEIGALFYEKCRLILHHCEEADTVVALMQAQMQGAIRISTSVAFGRRVMAPRILRFMRDHPKIQIDLSFEDRYVDLVEQGVDLAIRMGRLADSALGARYLGLNPWIVAASPAYLQRRGMPSTPEELVGHDALVYSTVQGDARWPFTARDGHARIVDVRGPLRSNNLSTLLLAARSDMGIAALPCYVAHDALASGMLVPVLGEFALPSQEIHAVYPSPRLVPVKVTTLIDWLQDRFPQRWWEESS